MNKRPTIHDVAERAGVSKSLVALVFKQDSGVSPDRRKRVLDAAAELGYTPNAWARSLRSNSGGFIGIIVADFHNPLFTEIADSARSILSEKGIFSFVATASYIDGPEGRTIDPGPIQHLLDLKPSSLLIVGSLPNAKPLEVMAGTLPIVVATATAYDLPHAVAIVTDDEEAMRLACAHFADLGHQSVGYIGPEGRPVAQERLSAFRKQTQAAGLKSIAVTTGIEFDERSGFEAASKLLARPDHPTAIVSYNDNVAFGVQEAIDRIGWTNRIAVVGYDNTYIAKLDRINLSSIAQPQQEIAAQACALLTNPELYRVSQGKEILVKPQLVVRRSSIAAR